jgi:hypothetical protein
MKLTVSPNQISILASLIMGSLERLATLPLPEFKAETALQFAKDMVAREQDKQALNDLLLLVNSATPEIEAPKPTAITIDNATIFKNADSAALLVHLSDGQTYRVGLTDPDQLRIGMEGLKMAFPAQLMDLDDDTASRAVGRGVLNGLPVAYRMAPGKVINPKTKLPYENMRLVANLAGATDDQMKRIMGDLPAHPNAGDGGWGEPAN